MKPTETAFEILMAIPLLFILAGCTHHAQIVKRSMHVTHTEKSVEQEFIPAQPMIKEPPPITIWVHGTKFFRRNQFSQYFEGIPSLKPASSFEEHHKYRKIALALYQKNRQEFPFHSCYFFGWSGNLSATERKQTAAYLYCEILKLIDQYKKKYKKHPIIRIFAHSHGGNVVLNMSRFTDQNNPEICIEECILLAVPVQELTRIAPHHMMFKRIYNLYASADFVQIIAPELRHKNTTDQYPIKSIKFPPFSNRTFPHHTKLVQAKIKINNKSIGHTYFVHLEFVALLPEIIKDLRTISDEENNKLQSKELLLSISEQRIKTVSHNQSSSEVTLLNELPE